MRTASLSARTILWHRSQHLAFSSVNVRYASSHSPPPTGKLHAGKQHVPWFGATPPRVQWLVVVERYRPPRPRIRCGHCAFVVEGVPCVAVRRAPAHAACHAFTSRRVISRGRAVDYKDGCTAISDRHLSARATGQAPRARGTDERSPRRQWYPWTTSMDARHRNGQGTHPHYDELSEFIVFNCQNVSSNVVVSRRTYHTLLSKSSLEAISAACHAQARAHEKARRPRDAAYDIVRRADSVFQTNTTSSTRKALNFSQRGTSRYR